VKQAADSEIEKIKKGLKTVNVTSLLSNRDK